MQVSRPAAFLAAAAVAVATLIAVGASWWLNYTPAVPSDQPKVHLGTIGATAGAATIVEASPASDTAADAPRPATAIAGSACLEPLRNAGGSMRLCWAVSRLLSEADPQKDYYVLQLDATLDGSGAGVDWAAWRALPTGGGGWTTLAHWPDPAMDGPCRSEPWNALGVAEMASPVCGRTESAFAAPNGVLEATWRSVGNPLPVHERREIAPAVVVSVSEGQIPTWDLFADFG